MRYVDRLVAAVKREPVRVRLYGLAALVAGYLLAKGYVDATDQEFIGSLVALVLGVERARANAVPVVKATRRRKRRR